jgi:Lrp/AsnC family leucine-responsive transcriptional regulator
MKDSLDETDAEILRLLTRDGRIPYTEIAEEVGMSPPSVIDRVDRLREVGVIEGFGARLDRSVMGGSRLLVRFRTRPGAVEEAVREASEDDRVETAFGSADGTVTLVANAKPEEAAELTAGFDARDHAVEVVVEESHEPTVSAPSFAPDCAECGNTVDEEGVSARLAGDVYHFCCTSCASAFEERYESLG